MSNETLIEKADLKVGDTYWFSGYWCTVTRVEACRIEGQCPIVGKIFGRFPYTSGPKDLLLGYIYEAGGKVTVRR